MSNPNEYTELAKKFAESTDKVKEIAEELKGKMENGEKLSQTAIDKADEALVTMNEVKLRLDDLEQKDARRGAYHRRCGYSAYALAILQGQS